MRTYDERPDLPPNPPRFAFLWAIVALVAIAAITLGVLALGGGLDARSTPIALTIVGLVVTLTTSLMTLAYSERTNRDLRNGTLRTQAKAATHDALREAAQSGGPVVTDLQALRRLLADMDAEERARQKQRRT